MSFLAPSRLGLLVFVVALGALYVVLQVRRRHYAVRFTNLDLLSSVAPRRPGWRRHIAATAVGVALVAFVVSLARPVLAQQVAKRQAIVMLTIDTSASMEATDVTPSRMESAIVSAQEFVDNLPDDASVGLVTFNKNATVVSNPTTEHDVVVAALGSLTTEPGTAAGDGITAALSAIDATLASNGASKTASDGTTKAPVASIVLLSDGATDVGTPVDEAAQAAADANVPITTIAYGTATGTIILDGKTITVPADPETLASVADATGGEFFEAASARELTAVYESIEQQVGYHTEHREVLRFFVGAGFVALLLAAAAATIWSGRFL